MTKRMLIDTTHPEETRVVVMNGTRLEQFDVETSTKKQIKGNIYLAKVVRVEPSLQAAFVEYGGNRHGFLAFDEIHPDYYQIPVADRQALIAAQAAEDALQAEHEEGVESVGGDDAEEASPSRSRRNAFRQYKIQEVIKRRQIMLIQVVKEERGGKGAALTTYLSLAGRYCVLMPNTARGGGVSRKITSATDRKRLKDIMSELEVPPSMAVILRTAGQSRTRAEIKRDFEYLMRTWNVVRDTTMQSRAPALIHEEGNLIKRAIRDVYSSDIDDVLVDGEEGYRVAKDFMRLLTPSHARRVQLYGDPTMPLFHRFQVDAQLDAMHSPRVELKSGGYIIINQTEALVAIDVNSGRATRERHIEDTAVKTNLEAADEVARQLRLRDLAGLIVVDFIDMEESRNNAAVERRIKDALKQDRARIQVGRISHFGLLELSRQRLRPSLQETSFEICPHCSGMGMVRSVESSAIHILRAIEEEGVRRRSAEVTVHVATPVALYILNNKRQALAEIEARYGLVAYLRGDDTLIAPEHRMDRVKGLIPPPEDRPLAEYPMVIEDPDDALIEEEEPEIEEEALAETEGDSPAAASGEAANGDGRKRRKRRKRRRGGNGGADAAAGTLDGADATGDDAGDESDDDDETSDEAAAEGAADAEVVADGEASGDIGEAGKRRSRRGGRRRRRGGENGREDGTAEAGTADAEAVDAVAEEGDEVVALDAEASGLTPTDDGAASPPRRRVRRRKAGDAAAESAAADGEEAAVAEEAVAVEAPAEAEEVAPRRRSSRRKAAEDKDAVAEAVVADVVVAEPEAAAVAETPVTETDAAETSVAETAVLETVAAEPVAPAAPEPAQAAVNRPVQVVGAAPADAQPKKGWWQRLLS